MVRRKHLNITYIACLLDAYYYLVEPVSTTYRAENFLLRRIRDNLEFRMTLRLTLNT